MNVSDTQAALRALPDLHVTRLDGEWRVTIHPKAVAVRYPNRRASWIAKKAEAMAYYTEDNADAVGTAKAMVVRWQAVR